MASGWKREWKTVSFNLEPKLYEQLKRLAIEQGLPVSILLRSAVRFLLDSYETEEGGEQQ